MIKNLIKNYRTIAVVANPGQGKSSYILNELIQIRKKADNKKKEYNELYEKIKNIESKDSNFIKKREKIKKISEYYNNFEVYTYGTEESLHPILNKYGIKIMYNSEDIEDMKVTGCLIFIDEINQLYSGKAKDHKTRKFFKFINRIYHLNNYLIATTAESGYWNKTMEDAFRCFIVKSIEYDSLVQRTKLKRKVEGLYSTSSYRLDIPINTYYVINDEVTEKHTFEYNPELDSKKENINLFSEEIDLFNAETFKNKLDESLDEEIDDKLNELNQEKCLDMFSLSKKTPEEVEEHKHKLETIRNIYKL